METMRVEHGVGDLRIEDPRDAAGAPDVRRAVCAGLVGTGSYVANLSVYGGLRVFGEMPYALVAYDDLSDADLGNADLCDANLAGV
jgi:hypothetical protein